MDLAKELAVMCVGSMEKSALEPTDIRNQFEQSELNENVLRRHADRLKTLADERAAREDMSTGGYIDTATQRMLPIPASMGEAAWRLPTIAAGGAAGNILGKNVSAADPLGIHRMSTVLDPAKVKSTMSGKSRKDVANALRRRLATGHTPADLASVSNITKQLGSADRSQIGELLQRGPKFLRSNRHAATTAPMQSELSRLYGKKGMDVLREELNNVLQKAPKGKTSIPSQVASHLDPYALGGTAAGVLGATALTGLPLAAKALWHKQHGGEAAVAARSSVQRAIEQANSEAAKREALLKHLPQEAAV